MKWKLAILFVCLAFLAHSEEKARFASVFSDNLVLKQKAAVKLWGFANPNEKLTLNCSWLNSGSQLVADRDGIWIVSVRTPQGSFKTQSVSLTDSNGSTETLSNVLIGEVWLCSGQSNMAMILKSQPEWNLIVENSEEEIARSNQPNIRFINIQPQESFAPLKEAISNGWKMCTPNDVKWLSAVAYFFGKKLFKELNVPIGLIVTAYGGSPIQSWIPENVINAYPLYEKEKIDREAELLASSRSEADYVEAMSNWITDSEKRSIQKLENETRNLILPVNFEKSEVGNQMGEIALSKKIEITGEQVGQDLQVNLGMIDDLGRVYFDGELVWEELRNSKSYRQVQFTVPAGKVRKGTNLFEVRVLNLLWGGGLTGPAENMYLKIGNNPAKISMTGEWQYKKIFDLAVANTLPHEGKPLFSTASSLYNGMIYPLKDYRVSGCLWYQGESNVGDEQRYPDMFTDLITSWRKFFKQNLPFYYVQIAPYKYGGNQDAKAAALREAQAKVEKSVSKTGMVVTMDLGNPTNIHPAKKREVGERLANMALAETYRKNIPSKFPTLKKAKCIGSTVVLTFSNVYKGLESHGSIHQFEISSDGKIYYPADIQKIFANTIFLFSKNAPLPGYIRYCWQDAGESTVFNSEKLPLTSFQSKVSK